MAEEKQENHVPGQDLEDMLILPSSSHFLLLLQVGQQAQLNHQLFSETGQFLLGKEQKKKKVLFSQHHLSLSVPLWQEGRANCPF